MKEIDELKNAIRDIVDFPQKGIVFRDITPILLNPALCQFVIGKIVNGFQGDEIGAVAGIESRGFLFGMSLAQKLGVGFIPVRKKGKLPHETFSMSYELEYGNAEVEIHRDAISPGLNVHIHDDLLATGGTAQATAKLIREAGGEVSSFSFLIELKDLKGKEKLRHFSNNINALVVY